MSMRNGITLLLISLVAATNFTNVDSIANNGTHLERRWNLGKILNSGRLTPREAAEKSFPPGTLLKEWRVDKYLGAGAHGMVFAVDRDPSAAPKKHRLLNFLQMPAASSHPVPAAAKLVPLSRMPFAKNELDKEFAVMAYLYRDKNLRKYLLEPIDIFSTKRVRALVMERAQGTLSGLIDNYVPAVDMGLYREAALRPWLRNMAFAISRLHKHGYSHGDLKAENLLVAVHDGTPVPVLADFGLARPTLPGKSYRRPFPPHGSIRFISPESATFSPFPYHSPARADIHALGQLFHELLFGATIPRSIVRNFVVDIDPVGKVVSAAMLDLLQRMVWPKAEQRIDIEDVVNHPALSLAGTSMGYEEMRQYYKTHPIFKSSPVFTWTPRWWVLAPAQPGVPLRVDNLIK